MLYWATIRRAQSWFGTSLIAVGIAMIVLTGALYAYGEFERISYENEQVVRERFDAATVTAVRVRRIVATSTANGLANATAMAEADAEAARVARSLPQATITANSSSLGPGTQNSVNPPTIPASALVAATPVRRATPIPTVVPVEAIQVREPAVIKHIVATVIGLNSAVVDSKIINGEWQVPRFSAGHLQGTGLPGEGRNVVLSGHVQSLTSGNVFSRIDQLKIGDDVTLRTTEGDVAYRISGKSIVPNDDLSVIQSSGREELTLITCTGTFNVFTRDYSHRWIVWGDRVP